MINIKAIRRKIKISNLLENNNMLSDEEKELFSFLDSNFEVYEENKWVFKNNEKIYYYNSRFKKLVYSGYIWHKLSEKFHFSNDYVDIGELLIFYFNHRFKKEVLKVR